MSNVLQDIFSDYYEQILYEIHPRRSVIENIDRMVSCGDPSHGGAMYGCPCCGNLLPSPRRKLPTHFFCENCAEKIVFIDKKGNICNVMCVQLGCHSPKEPFIN